MFIGRQPGMAVRMPTPINQLFNDESIAVQIIFLDDYTWNQPWIQWNTGLIDDGLEFQGYFVIFLDIVFQEQCGGDCSYNVYFAHTCTWP